MGGAGGLRPVVSLEREPQGQGSPGGCGRGSGVELLYLCLKAGWVCPSPPTPNAGVSGAGARGCDVQRVWHSRFLTSHKLGVSLGPLPPIESWVRPGGQNHIAEGPWVPGPGSGGSHPERWRSGTAVGRNQDSYFCLSPNPT